jgi:DNA-directed RNA polymerase subunit RPC12/RpoP
MIKFQCHNCGKKLGIADSEAGLLATCPNCNAKVRIPGQRRGQAGVRPSAAKPPPTKPGARPGKRAEPEDEVMDLELDEPDNRRRPAAAPKRGGRARDADVEEPEEVEEESPKRRGVTKERAAARRGRDEDEDDDRGRGRAKGRRRRDDDEDEDDDRAPKGGLTANRIRGIVGIVMAGIALTVGLLLPQINPTADPDIRQYMRFGLYGVSGLMAIAGVFYIIKG